MRAEELSPISQASQQQIAPFGNGFDLSVGCARQLVQQVSNHVIIPISRVIPDLLSYASLTSNPTS